MMCRCHREKNHNYHLYGGRGIHVQESWHRNARGFIEYIETTLGEKPSTSHTLDRIDNNKGYEEGNIRWATMREQCNNRKNNLMIAYGGENLSSAQWARRVGINRQVIRNRIARGWSSEKALNTPVKK